MESPIRISPANIRMVPIYYLYQEIQSSLQISNNRETKTDL